MSQINIIDFSEKEAIESAKIRADLEKKGTPIGPIDVLIAGCAIANNLILVTRNTKEFQRVENLKLVNAHFAAHLFPELMPPTKE